MNAFYVLHETASVPCHNVLECGAWAGPSGYLKMSRPTPWLLRSKHYESMHYGYTHTHTDTQVTLSFKEFLFLR